MKKGAFQAAARRIYRKKQRRQPQRRYHAAIYMGGDKHKDNKQDKTQTKTIVDFQEH